MLTLLFSLFACDEQAFRTLPPAGEIVVEQEAPASCYVDTDADGYVAPEGDCHGDPEGADLDCDDTDPAITEECYGSSAHEEQSEEWIWTRVCFGGLPPLLVSFASGEEAQYTDVEGCIRAPPEDPLTLRLVEAESLQAVVPTAYEEFSAEATMMASDDLPQGDLALVEVGAIDRPGSEAGTVTFAASW